MPLRRGLRTPLALLVALLLGLAYGQPTYTIGLDQSASGVVATDATTHVYLLDVPAGTAGFTIEVRGEDRDADLAVYFGDEQLHYDISSETNPTFALASPRAGRYRIEVLNLLWQDLPYTIQVRTGAVGAQRPTPPVAGSGSVSSDGGSIELGGTRTGVIPAAEIYREYALQVPAGTRGFTVRLTAGGADADMAVYYGSEELYDDISVDPNPVFTLANPRAGGYRIVVKNLLADDLDYVLRVEADGAAPTRPGAGAAALELGSGVVAPGAPIVVRFAGAPGNPRDWIGLYARGAEDRQFASWQYLEGAAAGQRTFVAPNDLGAYEFRMFANDGYDRLAVSPPFDVEVLAVPGGGPGSAPGTLGPSTPLTCGDNAQGETLGDLTEGARATVSCPANCSAGASVWGTDVYTDDSNVCAAAAHAGAIDLARGGSFVVSILPGSTSYVGSARHGVTSRNWGSWRRSFAIVSASSGPAPTAPASSGATATVTSDAEGTVANAAGVRVEVPAGAVPVTIEGAPGTMVFSIEPAATPAAPPSGFAVAGATYQIGPDGLTLEQPVRLVFPIPDGVDLADVVGLTTFDAAEGAWVVVPGTVDPIARTVTVWTDHLSPWAVATWAGAPRTSYGGTLRITNSMTRGGGVVFPCAADDPNCRPGLPTGHGFGVCLVSWDLEDPAQRFWSTRDGVSRAAVATDGQTTDFWLPNGTYVVEPYFHMSQINQSPLYVPRHQMYVQPTLAITVRDGDVIAFGDDYPRGYVEGWSTCFGGSGAGSQRGPITSVGTGDVQVTLTWQADVDVDLYVTDPAGDTVYYGNRRVSSGGELDRDNMCGDFEWGRPENVYWPQAGAPAGTYTVKVRYYGSCGSEGPTVAWTVRVIAGGSAQSFTGVLAPYDEQAVTTFTVR
jgi:hypothetical protein